MKAKRTAKGWTITHNTGMVLWYSDATIRAAGYDPDDDPNGIAGGEYCPRAEYLCARQRHDRAIRSGH